MQQELLKKQGLTKEEIQPPGLGGEWRLQPDLVRRIESMVGPF